MLIGEEQEWKSDDTKGKEEGGNAEAASLSHWSSPGSRASLDQKSWSPPGGKAWWDAKVAGSVWTRGPFSWWVLFITRISAERKGEGLKVRSYQVVHERESETKWTRETWIDFQADCEPLEIREHGLESEPVGRHGWVFCCSLTELTRCHYGLGLKKDCGLAQHIGKRSKGVLEFKLGKEGSEHEGAVRIC